MEAPATDGVALKNNFQQKKSPTTRAALARCNPRPKHTMSMITATTWVPRGFAAPFPTKYQFDDDEYERISKLANLQLEDAKDELEEAQAQEKSKKKKGPAQDNDDE